MYVWARLKALYSPIVSNSYRWEFGVLQKLIAHVEFEIT